MKIPNSQKTVRTTLESSECSKVQCHSVTHLRGKYNISQGSWRGDPLQSQEGLAAQNQLKGSVERRDTQRVGEQYSAQ